MQSFGDNYDVIRRSGNCQYETVVIIYTDPMHTVEFHMNQLLSLNIQSSLFGDGTPSVGNCVSAELNVQILGYQKDYYDRDVNIPKAAKVIVMTKAYNDELSTGFIRMGVFYIDTREKTDNGDGMDILTIHAYDSMLLAEKDYPSTTGMTYPMRDYDMLRIVASSLGINIEGATLAKINKGYMFPLPAGLTCRQVLSRIAASYGGNFTITGNGTLRLIKLNEEPEETFYLVNNAGEPIVIGGERIVVSN